VIASHYAEPVARKIVVNTLLRGSPSEDGEVLRGLAPGEPFLLLDDSAGWAWGYAGDERRVGYTKNDTIVVP
jgi:hypothetical protein